MTITAEWKIPKSMVDQSRKLNEQEDRVAALKREREVLKQQREQLREALGGAESMLIEQEDALRCLGCDEPNAEPTILSARDALESTKPEEDEGWLHSSKQPNGS